MKKRLAEFGIWAASIMLAMWVGYRDGVNDERTDTLHREMEASASMEVRSVELRFDEPDDSVRVNLSARVPTNGDPRIPPTVVSVSLADLFQPALPSDRESTANMLSDVRLILRSDGTLRWELEPWAGIRPIPPELRFPWLRKGGTP